jgi:hypothetical protein
MPKEVFMTTKAKADKGRAKHNDQDREPTDSEINMKAMAGEQALNNEEADDVSTDETPAKNAATRASAKERTPPAKGHRAPSSRSGQQDRPAAP